MVKTAVVILAEGFEEVEAIGPVDVLRRAGVRVTLAGVGSMIVKSSRGVIVHAEILLEGIKELPDAVIVPGGMPGTTNLKKSPGVGEFLKKMHAAKKIIAAICAAPAGVLAPLGILNFKKATCYPGCETDFSDKVAYSKDRVVVDGNIITSQGPGTALEFSLAVADALVDKGMAETLREKMIIKA